MKGKLSDNEKAIRYLAYANSTQGVPRGPTLDEFNGLPTVLQLHYKRRYPGEYDE